jgi:ribose 5-phosphate isomerase B
MKIAFACDHGGFPIKADILEAITDAGHQLIDLGTYDETPVDYPDYVEKACKLVQDKKVDRAVIVCGSGIGACITANKMQGIYAGICHDTYSAHQGVEHDDMNVLCMGARVIGPALGRDITSIFLSSRFSNEERHIRRLAKMKKIEKER